MSRPRDGQDELRGYGKYQGVFSPERPKHSQQGLAQLRRHLRTDEKLVLMLRVARFSSPKSTWLGATDDRLLLVNSGTLTFEAAWDDVVLEPVSAGLRVHPDTDDPFKLPVSGPKGAHLEGLLAVCRSCQDESDSGPFDSGVPATGDVSDPAAGDADATRQVINYSTAYALPEGSPESDSGSASMPTSVDGIDEESAFAEPAINEAIHAKLRARHPELRPDFLTAAARGVNTLVNDRGRLAFLQRRIEPDERVIAIVMCSREAVALKLHGALAVTDQRVCFAGWPSTGTEGDAEIHSIPVASIANIDRSTRMMTAHLHLESPAGTMRLSNLLKVQTTWVIDAIRNAQAAARAGEAAIGEPEAPTPAKTGIPAAIDSLRELAELHGQGVLSDEEFAAMKSKVLGSD